MGCGNSKTRPPETTPWSLGTRLRGWTSARCPRSPRLRVRPLLPPNPLYPAPGLTTDPNSRPTSWAGGQRHLRRSCGSSEHGQPRPCTAFCSDTTLQPPGPGTWGPCPGDREPGKRAALLVWPAPPSPPGASWWGWLTPPVRFLLLSRI